MKKTFHLMIGAQQVILKLSHLGNRQCTSWRQRGGALNEGLNTFKFGGDTNDYRVHIFRKDELGTENVEVLVAVITEDIMLNMQSNQAKSHRLLQTPQVWSSCRTLGATEACSVVCDREANASYLETRTLRMDD